MGTIMLSESASRNIRTEAQAIETAEMLLCNLDVTSALLPPYLSPDLDLKTWGRGTHALTQILLPDWLGVQ